MPPARQRVRFPCGDCVTERLAPVPPAAGSRASPLSDPGEIALQKHSAASRNPPHPTRQDSGAREGFWRRLEHRPPPTARRSVGHRGAASCPVSSPDVRPHSRARGTGASVLRAPGFVPPCYPRKQGAETVPVESVWRGTRTASRFTALRKNDGNCAARARFYLKSGISFIPGVLL